MSSMAMMTIKTIGILDAHIANDINAFNVAKNRCCPIKAPYCMAKEGKNVYIESKNSDSTEGQVAFV